MIKCQVEGCPTTINPTEPVTLTCRYICSKHTRAEQWKALNRTADDRKDYLDADVRFQDCQFDKDLKRGRRPVDTDHIQRQGSEIDDQQEKIDLNEEHLEGIN
jgi:hypothetical protein